MKLRLNKVVAKNTVTHEQYFELTFFNPHNKKEVRYWLWSFVHNEENNLAHIWDMALKLVVGTLYEVQFKKAQFGGRTQHVITTLAEVDGKLTFVE